MSTTDVLLVYPPYSYPKKSPPIGLAYIAAILENKGYSVKIVDMSVLRMGYDDLKRQVEWNRPRLAGISFMTNQYEQAINVSKVIKEVDIDVPVITGGPHVSALPEEILGFESVDVAVFGEAEITISEMADDFLNGANSNLAAINGIAYRKEGNIYVNERRQFISDLDSIPFPAWHLLPIERYAIPATGGDPSEHVFAVITSRGCPNQCIFCDSHTVFGRKFRARSAQNIFDELVYLNSALGATQFDFVDDTITVSKNRIRELCSLILANNCRFKWMCNARVNTVDRELLQMMKNAGCVRVEFGIETGDPEVLKKMKKAVTIEQIKDAHAVARAVGLSIGSFVMVGNIGEDFSSVVKTKALLEQIDTDDIFISIATPFPGTELYAIAKNNGWLRIHDWSKYVTAPTYLPGYQPIMETDKMNSQEILHSFFYLHSQFAKKKFNTRYGSLFFLNKRFYKDNILNIRSAKEFWHRIGLSRKLIRSYLQR